MCKIAQKCYILEKNSYLCALKKQPPIAAVINTQTQQVIDTLRQIGGYATFRRLNELVDFSTWATKTPEASVRRIVQDSPISAIMMLTCRGKMQNRSTSHSKATSPYFTVTVWNCSRCSTTKLNPTQKPLGLLSRIIMASTKPGAWILDPFAGSSTTGIAANLLGRRFLGIEKEDEFVKISMARRKEIEDGRTFATFKKKIPDIVKAEDTQQD